MMKSLAAVMLSATIALTGMIAASPARADNDDIARIIGGIAALAILGAAIDAANDDRRPSHGVTVVRPGQGYGYGHTTAMRLPAQCQQVFHTDRGPRAFFARRCTQNNVAFPHLLPDNCLRQIHTNHGLRSYYAGPCMRRAGWAF